MFISLLDVDSLHVWCIVSAFWDIFPRCLIVIESGVFHVVDKMIILMNWIEAIFM